MHHTSSRFLICATVTFAAFVCAAHAEVISTLGTLGGSYSRGFGVNASGQVTGGSNAAGSSSNRGYLYTGGTMHDLGTLGGPITFAFAINASGHVAGSSLFSPTSGAQRAFIYTGIPGAGGMMHDLGTLGGTSSRGTAINDSGQLTGNSGIMVGSTAAHAFRYTGGLPGSGGVMQDLGTLGGATSRGYGINASGQVVGDSQFPGGSASQFRGFFYAGTPGVDGVMHDLGTLGGTSSAANGINASGQIAGASQVTASTDYHAFLYTGTPGAGGMMRDLGTLGGAGSAAYAINTAGQLVGAANNSGGAEHAFIYTGTPGLDGVMTDLDAWLDAVHPAEGAKWTLSDAAGLTDNGLITGTGTFNDGAGGLSDGLRAYLLDATAISNPIPGDANFDAKVDITDLGILATYWQMPGNRSQGDFNGTGFIDITDLGILATNWQVGVAAGSSDSLADAMRSLGLNGSTVPEPSVLGLVVGQFPLLYRRRPRRR